MFNRMLAVPLTLQLMLLASPTFAQESAKPSAGTGQNPADTEQPAIRNRVYSTDTSSYDVDWPLGRFGLVDRKLNTITSFIEKPRSACESAKLRQTLKMKTMPPSQAYYYVAEKSYSGSLSFFTANAEMKDTDRQQLTLTDIGTADIDPPCELSNSKVFEIAKSLRGTAGKRVFWVSGATLSNLNKQVFKEQKWGVEAEAGSWLSIDAKGYKGEQKIDAVPVMSLRGIFVDVPSGSNFSTGPTAKSTMLPVEGRFYELSDLGLAGDKLTFVTQATE